MDFLRSSTGNGNYYSRAGNFGINANEAPGTRLGPHRVGARAGHQHSPGRHRCGDQRQTARCSIAPADPPDLQTAGQIQLATFINPDGLLKVGDNLYQATRRLGQPRVSGTPRPTRLGVLARALEASNVEPVQELIDLITTQRAFELNSQVVQAGDQIMQIAANLRRG